MAEGAGFQPNQVAIGGAQALWVEGQPQEPLRKLRAVAAVALGGLRSHLRNEALPPVSGRLGRAKVGEGATRGPSRQALTDLGASSSVMTRTGSQEEVEKTPN